MAPPPRLIAYNPAPGLYIFRVLPLTPCMLLLAGCYTPLPKGRHPETSRTQQSMKVQAEGRVSADTDSPTHFYWGISDD